MRIKHLISIATLIFSTNVFAQTSAITANMSEEQLLAAVQAAVAAGETPNAIAQALVNSGQDTQTIGQVMAQSNIAPQAIATSVQAADPAVNGSDLQVGVQNGGVSALQAAAVQQTVSAQQITQAIVSRPPQIPAIIIPSIPPAPTIVIPPAPVAGGNLIDVSTGTVQDTSTEDSTQQARETVVASVVQTNPDFLDTTTVTSNSRNTSTQ